MEICECEKGQVFYVFAPPLVQRSWAGIGCANAPSPARTRWGQMPNQSPAWELGSGAEWEGRAGWARCWWFCTALPVS